MPRTIRRLLAHVGAQLVELGVGHGRNPFSGQLAGDGRIRRATQVAQRCVAWRPGHAGQVAAWRMRGAHAWGKTELLCEIPDMPCRVNAVGLALLQELQRCYALDLAQHLRIGTRVHGLQLRCHVLVNVVKRLLVVVGADLGD